MIAAKAREIVRPARVEAEELIDSFEHDEAAFRRTYDDIRWINRWLGGVSVVRRELRRLGLAEATMLDVATGSGDIPSQLGPGAVGIDANPNALAIAKQEVSLRLVRGDARALPFADGAFDVVTCSLTLHHFGDREAVAILREMHRVARRAVIVNDLRRGRLPSALIWIVTRALRMHPLTRHDAPLSVMRARTLAEYRRLAAQAGLPSEVRAHPFWRAAMVVRR